MSKSSVLKNDIRLCAQPEERMELGSRNSFSNLHTEEIEPNPVKLIIVCTVITLFRFIWHQTESRWVPNKSEKVYKIQK